MSAAQPFATLEEAFDAVRYAGKRRQARNVLSPVRGHILEEFLQDVRTRPDDPEVLRQAASVLLEMCDLTASEGAWHRAVSLMLQRQSPLSDVLLESVGDFLEPICDQAGGDPSRIDVGLFAIESRSIEGDGDPTALGIAKGEAVAGEIAARKIGVGPSLDEPQSRAGGLGHAEIFPVMSGASLAQGSRPTQLPAQLETDKARVANESSGLIAVPPPGEAVVSQDGVETYRTQPVSLHVARRERDTVLTLRVGDVEARIELGNSARAYLIDLLQRDEGLA